MTDESNITAFVRAHYLDITLMNRYMAQVIDPEQDPAIPPELAEPTARTLGAGWVDWLTEVYYNEREQDGEVWQCPHLGGRHPRGGV